jgi:hypothetical protein
MLRGFLRRAAVAILLMGALVAPLGVCLQPAHKTAHSCCAPESAQGNTMQMNCCVASAPLPGMVVVATELPGPAPVNVVQEFVALDLVSAASDLPIATVIPPHSPPPGAFNLRI